MRVTYSRRIEALSFQLINFAYHAALAILVGGGLVLGLATAPALFRTLPSRAEAGTAFSEVLARYDGLAVLSVIVVAVAAILRAVNFETVDERHWVRWAALLIMGAAALYASAWSNPVARQLRRQMPAFDELPEGAPARREFAKLHAASRRAMSLATVSGLAALFLS